MGGFKEERMVSDTDMWHRMALQYPVVLMPDGIVWQRRHDAQELNDADDFIIKGAEIKWKYLLDPSCPLKKKQISTIRKRRIKRYIGFILAGIKNGDWKQVKTYWQCMEMTLKIKN
jgi:hypothetical protein